MCADGSTGTGAAGLAAALTARGGPDDGASGGGENAGAGPALAATSDTPEGGGKVFAARKVVVTQPAAGEFEAFAATRTHQGCAVRSVADGVIDCPCRNSTFSIADGSVRSGPAPKPLPPPTVRITVGGDSIQPAG
ncbi:Rieske 2Fe-2S domain-containing protein [Streptomyces lancefieldiae]|uniref:Rieske 2Fe-2S domain-containing protein n=1 Tax=Streptomyces lancefieldiae TaxID=3075520 RepID=A0ABU3ALE0_9ACTN|nr:Rieske 2Fe-2S domain-containing protein [Streptomyces sp. DSM 40712]MDT0611014.1 Rieske 2Fe-2S domain-containing protein [Streptomyces sp. DSM 40712]